MHSHSYENVKILKRAAVSFRTSLTSSFSVFPALPLFLPWSFALVLLPDLLEQTLIPSLPGVLLSFLSYSLFIIRFIL